MNYLIINGSPRKGNTWKLVEATQNNIQKRDATAVFEVIHLAETKLPFCSGCSNCFRLGHEKCPHNKIVIPIIEQMARSDGIIISSSTYYMRETALMKNFIDHLCFLLHRPYFFRSKALVITTTGGVGARSSAKSIASFLKGIGFNRCYCFSVAAYSWNDYRIKEKTSRKLEKITDKFYKDICSGKIHSPTVSVLIPYNLFRGMSLSYAKGSEYETEDGVYWLEESRRKNVYDSSVPVPFYKKIIGHIFYFIGKIAGRKFIITYKK